jgi:hypothetical protein
MSLDIHNLLSLPFCILQLSDEAEDTSDARARSHKRRQLLKRFAPDRQSRARTLQQSSTNGQERALY